MVAPLVVVVVVVGGPVVVLQSPKMHCMLTPSTMHSIVPAAQLSYHSVETPGISSAGGQLTQLLPSSFSDQPTPGSQR